jgi:23S rRNA (guanine745-N1)-methyltransferase
MNIRQTADAYERITPLLRCPLCKKPVSLVRPGSLVCGSRHCFDLSSRGYVSFLAGKGVSGGLYDRELFVNRALVMRAGYYDLAVSELCALLGGGGRILDAGCGEGFFTAAISSAAGAATVGLDNCAQAIRLAAAQYGAAWWLAADLANIPLQSESMDAVVNILAPANYAEFSRVLVPGGKIIKVIPGDDYLCQLRHCAAGLLRSQSHDSRVVAEHFARNTRITCSRTVYTTLPLHPGILDAFIRMTPMLAGIPAEDIPCLDIKEITIHLKILVGEKKPLSDQLQ